MKVTATLRMPLVEFDFNKRILKVEATPNTKLTIQAYKRAVMTTKIPSSGKLSIKIPKAKLGKIGDTMWVFTSNNKGRSEFAQFRNIEEYYSTGDAAIG